MRPEAGLEIQDRYRLTTQIALGGMGEVWRAQDLRSGRVVAVKVLRPELTGDEIFLSRLRAEASNSRGLRHPNLAVVLDAGEREGSGWIVMELVEGRPLSEILSERGTLPAEEILPVVAQVARALQVVHDAGVVHRDVKPSNILVNREGLAKLTDFGISTGAHQRPMTATGMVMGTAQYLSPEQAMGHMATPAGDLYSLGVIAFEALVGKRPFTGTTQVDIAYAHVNDPVPELPDTVPPQVRELVHELLAKRPAARPASARELARRIDRVLVNLPADSWDPRRPRSWRSTGRTEAPAALAGSAPPTAAATSESTRSRPTSLPPSVPLRSRVTSGSPPTPRHGSPTVSAPAARRHHRGRTPSRRILVLAIMLMVLLGVFAVAGTLTSAHAATVTAVVLSDTRSEEAL